MEQLFLIDSNIVIDYLGKKITPAGMSFMDECVNNIPRISVVTKIEVLGYTIPLLYASVITDFMNDADIYKLTDDIVDTCITIRKQRKIKLPDAIIASTALVHNLTIVTRNISDFGNISGVNVINPYTL